MRHHFRHPQAMCNKGSRFYSHCELHTAFEHSTDCTYCDPGRLRILSVDLDSALGGNVKKKVVETRFHGTIVGMPVEICIFSVQLTLKKVARSNLLHPTTAPPGRHSRSRLWSYRLSYNSSFTATCLAKKTNLCLDRCSS
jgi:hypothetical protein